MTTKTHPFHSSHQQIFRVISNDFHADGHFKVIKRDGTLVPFDTAKIRNALLKAFYAADQSNTEAQSVHQNVEVLVSDILGAIRRRSDLTCTLPIEDIQDLVELALMRNGHHKIARAYVLYREERAKLRRQAHHDGAETGWQVRVIFPQGEVKSFSEDNLRGLFESVSDGLDAVDFSELVFELKKNIYNDISSALVIQAAILAARPLIERHPAYSFMAARLLLRALYQESFDFLGISEKEHEQSSEKAVVALFKRYIDVGIEKELLHPDLLNFDLERLALAIKPERDQLFQFLGLQTLYDRYFLHYEETRFEIPQFFFMRVAMGLALREKDKESWAIAFYDLISSFDFMCSTPTLFNSGTLRPQLSSCFLTTIGDDLDDIFKGIKDNALLSKYSGGLGNDWTSVRGMGARIKGTNGKSQGVVPFLKVANDTAVAVNQGGKRKGAVCAYLETWHLDVEDFLDLRKNTGDERRRTHDMNTANWIPDLFLERVEAGGEWTLFSPEEVPDLHDLYGKAFKERYMFYEEQARLGNLHNTKCLPAVDLWRKMLSMLFETGHPWITFKDPCNLRSPQRHQGVVHSSNLCTEITLNTSREEVAVCNLGSINLVNHVGPKGLLLEKIQKTTQLAMRLLDNVIDVNFYTIPEARLSNQRHRPVGLGIMGFHDALIAQKIPYASQEALDFADYSMEAISYAALEASSDLALERGAYETFEGSLWSQGVLPIDSIAYVDEARGKPVLMNRKTTLDWGKLREKIRSQKIRNSNTLAIAPTATISNICGVSQSIEPHYRNLFVKSNMSGEFTVINARLVQDLKAINLWDEAMISDIKFYDGSLKSIERIPEALKTLYATAFEIEPEWLIKAAAARQKWIDQSQSLNLYMSSPSGRKLDEMYRLAWNFGLKTTYYLRSQSATHVEKSTLKRTDGRLNAVSVMENTSVGQACGIDDPTCEACQ